MFGTILISNLEKGVGIRKRVGMITRDGLACHTRRERTLLLTSCVYCGIAFVEAVHM